MAKRKKTRKPRQSKKAETSTSLPKIKTHFQSPGEMALCGPLVPATLDLPLALKEKLAELGRPIPDPISGFFLVDTGASKTSICEATAAELGLKPVRKTETYGVSGKAERPVYHVRMEVPATYENGKPFLLQSENAATGVKDLDQFFRGGDGPKDQSGNEVRVIGLLGREFLAHCLMYYGGSEGRFEIWVDPDTL